VLFGRNNQFTVQKLINVKTILFDMKSQISLEFLVGIIFLFIIYVVSLSGFSSFAKTQLIQNEEAKQACYTVSSAISAADVGGPGFSMNVSLPYRIDNEFNFLVIILNRSSVDINWPNGFYSCSMITQNVTNLQMYAGKFSLNNVNRTIYVSSVSTDKLLYNTSGQVIINGTYFLHDVSISVYNNDEIISGYPKTVPVVNYAFSDSFVSSAAGHYKVKVNDINTTTFYAEREFDIE